MKILYKIFFVLLVVLSSCSDKDNHEIHEQHEEKKEKKTYTCPMHPEIIRDKPGQCPICGMDLVEKKSEGESIKDTSMQFLLKPTNQYVISSVKTITLKEKEIPLESSATGTITYDTRYVHTVSARVSGRIEKLYVKYKYQPIRKGEKLMDIYSKELVTEQENYLFLIKNDSGNTAIIKSAENNLQLLGLNKDQIETLKKSEKVFQSVTIYSPYSGHLHDASAPASELMNKNTMENRELSFHEGMYVGKGQTIFNIYSTEKVWAILNFYSDKQSALKEDQPIELEIAGLDQTVSAKVDFIEPIVKASEKTISIRSYLNNKDGKIKIGANVKAVISGANSKGFFVPSKAVLNLGLSNVVFVKKENLFKATPVTLGVRTDKWAEILSGVQPGDELAENAQLLMDSESFIKTDSQ